MARRWWRFAIEDGCWRKGRGGCEEGKVLNRSEEARKEESFATGERRSVHEPVVR